MSTRSIIVITGKTYSGQSETIRLYKHSDGYPTGNPPQDTYNKGTVDPTSYADNLIEECQDNERKMIHDQIVELKELRFTINGGEDNS